MSSLPLAELLYQTEHIRQDHGPVIAAVLSVFGLIALTCLVLRLIQRLHSGVGYCLDDWFMLIAAFPTCACVVSAYMLVSFGEGKHAVAISPSDFEPLGKWTLALIFTYAPAVTLIKLSILALIIRVFGWRDKFIRYGAILIAVYTLLWLLAEYLSTCLACRPLSTLWTAFKPCKSYKSIVVSISALNIFGDFMVIALPQARIWKLQMPLKRKVAVSLLMALGVFCSIAGIVRIATAFKIDPFDQTYYSSVSVIFAVIEPVLGIIAGCLPPTYLLMLSCCTRSSSGNKATAQSVTTTTASSKFALSDKNTPSVFCGESNLTWKIEKPETPMKSPTSLSFSEAARSHIANVRRSRREGSRHSRAGDDFDGVREIKRVTTISVTKE